jgi:hypothetical protein
MHRNNNDEITDIILKERDLILEEKAYLNIKKIEFEQMSLRDQIRCGNAIDKLYFSDMEIGNDHVYRINFYREAFYPAECYFKLGDTLDLYYENILIVDPLSTKSITGVLCESNFQNQFTLKITTYFNIYDEYFQEGSFSLKRNYNIDTYVKIASELDKLM